MLRPVPQVPVTLAPSTRDVVIRERIQRGDILSLEDLNQFILPCIQDKFDRCPLTSSTLAGVETEGIRLLHLLDSWGALVVHKGRRLNLLQHLTLMVTVSGHRLIIGLIPKQGNITVAKIRVEAGGIPEQEGIYIGRGVKGLAPSPVGNPFSAKEYGRLCAIDLYRVWLADKVRQRDPRIIAFLQIIREQVHTGEDVTLLCWCAPSPCHGDIIREAVLSWDF